MMREPWHIERETAPAGAFPEEARIWDHLRLDLSTGSPAEPADADQIRLYRDAAIAYLDGSEGVLGRALITQTWKMVLPRFPCRRDANHRDLRIALPLPPLQTVDSIVYTDGAGVEQTLDTADYTVLARGVDRGAVVPAYGKTWPATRAVADAVTVTFTAGYGDAAADVPAAIRSAALLIIGDMYETRTDAIVGASVASTRAVERLLAPYKVLY